MKKLLASAALAVGAAVIVLAVSLVRAPVTLAETPSEFIEDLADSAISVLVDESLTDVERKTIFRGVMVESFDLPLIGRYVLGVQWRRASAAQKDEYSALFEEFIVRIYSSRLKNFSGQSLQIRSARPASKDTVVATVVRGPDTPPIRVDWRVRGSDGSYKVVDIIIEGVSMVITKRDEFSSVIRRSGGKFEGLLARLREATTEYSAKQVRQADLDAQENRRMTFQGIPDSQ